MNMPYTKAELEGWVASQNPEDRKKVVNILKDEFGEDSLKMSDIVRLQPPDRVAKVLELQAKRGGGKAGGAKPGATKAAPTTTAKPGVGKKAAVRQPEPEPEPEQEQDEAVAGGASLEEIQAAVEAAVAPLAELLAAIQESLAEAAGAAMRAEIMAKQAALAGGFSEEDLDALVSGE